VTAVDAAGKPARPPTQAARDRHRRHDPAVGPDELARDRGRAGRQPHMERGHRRRRRHRLPGAARTARRSPPRRRRATPDPGLAASTPYTYTVIRPRRGGEPEPGVGSGDRDDRHDAEPRARQDRHDAASRLRPRPSRSPGLTTTQPGELLVAFLASDGPNGAGGPVVQLGDQRRPDLDPAPADQRSAGTAEIWQARAPTTVTNMVVTATRSGGRLAGADDRGRLIGADTTTLAATASANATTGAPSVALTTHAGPAAGSGASATTGTGRPRGPSGPARRWSTSSSRRRRYLLGAAPVPPRRRHRERPLTIGDTAPTTDRWNLAAMEILPGWTRDQGSGAAGSRPPPGGQTTSVGVAPVGGRVGDFAGAHRLRPHRFWTHLVDPGHSVREDRRLASPPMHREISVEDFTTTRSRVS